LGQAALVELGHADGLVVDGSYGETTVAAVEAFQEAAGWPVDGELHPHQVLVAPPGARVGSVHQPAGAEVTAHTPVLEVATGERVVDAQVPLEDQGLLAPGTTVEIVVDDATTVPGVVTAVDPVATAEPRGDGSTEATATVRIEVAAPVALTQVQLPVDVDVTEVVAPGALTVPVAALVALAEGGYAVELVEGTATRLVAVETGADADGRVEVRGDGIVAGAMVVIP
jgi:hypothetical protein